MVFSDDSALIDFAVSRGNSLVPGERMRVRKISKTVEGHGGLPVSHLVVPVWGE
jgi:hypothetical protein